MSILKFNPVVQKTTFMGKKWLMTKHKSKGRDIIVYFKKGYGVRAEVYFPDSKEIDFTRRSETLTPTQILFQAERELEKRIKKNKSPNV